MVKHREEENPGGCTKWGLGSVAKPIHVAASSVNSEVPRALSWFLEIHGPNLEVTRSSSCTLEETQSPDSCVTCPRSHR